jgi:hypothetical protein
MEQFICWLLRVALLWARACEGLGTETRADAWLLGDGQDDRDGDAHHPAAR